MVSPPKSSKKASNNKQCDLEEALRSKSKRKLVQETEEISEKPHDEKDVGQELVGSGIKVWWQFYKMYREGVVDSFDPVERKHKILYKDGEIEETELRYDKWELIAHDTSSDGVEAANIPTPHVYEAKKRKYSARRIQDEEVDGLETFNNFREQEDHEIEKPMEDTVVTNKDGKISHQNREMDKWHIFMTGDEYSSIVSSAEIAGLKSRLSDLKAERDQLQTSLAQRDATICSLRKQVVGLMEQDQELVRARRQVALLEQSNEVLSDTVASLSTSVQRLGRQGLKTANREESDDR